jgi:hypothetical protein
MQPVDPMTAYFANIAAAGETGVAGFGRQGQISPDTGGSKSYGVFGLNTRGRNSSASRFAMQFGPTLGLTAPVGTPDFDQQWQGLAAKNPEALKKAQMDWFNGEITSKVAPSLTQLGIPDSVASDPRVQGYFSDRMVQQGPASTTKHAARIQSAFAQSNGDPVAFLHNVSAADKSALNNDFVTYLSEHPENARGLANRVDKRTALALNGEAGAEDNTGASTMMPALSPRNLAGGPGALSNTEDDEQSQSFLGRFWQKPEDGANALQQAGAYITSIADPKAGASLLAAAKAYGRNQNKGELKQTGTDIYGNPIYSVFDPVKRTLSPATMLGGAAGAAGTQPQMAPGVDNSLTGDDYLNQFPEDVKSAVKSYINGDVMPTGNPRNAALATRAKLIAQKYGSDLGIPVSDSLYSQKRTYRTQLGSNNPSSAGGQAKAFNQGIEHADALASSLESLDNSAGYGVPLVAKAINTGSQMLNTEQAAKAKKVDALAQTLSGEVGKLFSGASGGGVHEREETRKRFSSVSSPQELAGALEATLETMRGGLTALEQRRDEVLGPNSDVRFVNPETEKKIARIEAVIAKLKGQKGSTDAVAPAAAGPSIDDLITKYGSK